jgi:iron complex outermembrane receptor protein
VTNLGLHTRQAGVVITLDLAIGNLQVKPFVTFQKTNLLDYSPFSSSASAPPLFSNNFNPAVYNNNSNKGTIIADLGTPSYFGGAYINYKAGKKFNINVNTYFFGSNTQTEINNMVYRDGSRGVQNIPPVFLLNATIHYKVISRLSAFVNFRNILNDRTVQFYKGDPPAFMFLGGINFEY